MSFKAMLFALCALTLLTPLSNAHSWVEEYQVISANGSYTGARGYSRGYVPRTDPTYNGFSMMWMLPSLEARTSVGGARTRINSTDLLCHPAQRTANYTAQYPKLKVAPGDYVAMKYLENGHVTLPWNITGKPPGTGTVFIFGTTQPSDTETIADVMEWNKAGDGGNGKGFLLTAQNFDDGRCHQINCGSISEQRQMLSPNHVAGQPTSTVESWCETDLKIPENTATGTLTTYWVWQWPTEANADCNTPAGKDEYYTTCADFDVVGQDELSKINAAAPSQSVSPAESNPQSVAVKDYQSRTAYTATPSVALQNNNKVVGAIPTVKSAFASSCSAQASVISANSLGIWPEVYVPNSCSVVSSFGTAAASSAAKVFDSAAASYTSAASAAWSSAFAAAKMAVPSRSPWSEAPSTQAATSQAQQTSAPAVSTTAPASSVVSTSAPAVPSSAAPSSSMAAGEVTTITTVVTLTSTLPAGQSTPPSDYAEPSSSSSVAASSPAASSPSSSSSAPTSSGAAGAIPTVSTVGGTAPSAAPITPSVGTNGTVYRRSHPRAFPPP